MQDTIKIDALEKLDKKGLEELLKNLKLYKDLIKQVWNRGKTIFDNIFSWNNSYIVEYYWDLDEKYVLEKAQNVYKDIFKENVSEKDISLVKNDKIKWWIKVYFNDKLIDLSFLKFYNLLNK